MTFVAVRFGPKTIRLKSTASTTISALMEEIRDVTNVFPSRQSITWGLPRAQPLPTDAASLALTLEQVGLKRGELLTLTEQSHGPSSEAPRQGGSPIQEAVKIEIAPDNSCLFNAVSYCCTGVANQPAVLRELCVREIRAHPQTYTEVMLGQKVDAYCRWLLDPSHWGGYIEMDILSKHFGVEIAVMHIEEVNLVPVNSCAARERIFLLYDGMHYDSLVFRGFGIPEQRKVGVDDEKATQLAMEVTRLLQTSGAFTNENKMEMKCDRCGARVKGKKGAEEHGRQTGHSSFSQAQKK
jgi:hypothetical protein